MAHKDTKTFAEYQAMVRKRGALVMDTIEKELPNPVILSCLWIWDLKVTPEADYGLLNSFLCGMLEAADPGAVIIDGNERSYGYSDAEQYLRSFHRIRQVALQFIPPELHMKYRAQARVGQAVFDDALAGAFARHTMGTYMTPEERAMWMEFNAYWAMRTTDKYVWWWTERIHYLDDKGLPPAEGFIEAIERAKKKIHDPTLGGPPDIAPIMKRAWKAMRAAACRLPTMR